MQLEASKTSSAGSEMHIEEEEEEANVEGHVNIESPNFTFPFAQPEGLLLPAGNDLRARGRSVGFLGLERAPLMLTRAGLHAPGHPFSPDSHAGLTSVLNVYHQHHLEKCVDRNLPESHGPQLALVFVDGRDRSRRHSQTFCVYCWEGDPVFQVANSVARTNTFQPHHR